MTTTSEHIVRAGTIAALVACLLTTGVALGEKAFSGWNGAPLLLFCVLAAIEAYAAYRLLHGVTLRTALAHIAIFVVLAQLYVDAVEGQAPLQDFVPYLSGRLFGYFIPVFLTWLAVTEVMRPLAVLESPPDAGFLDQSPVRRLTVYFFAAGIALFVAAGITQPTVAHLLKLPHAGTGSPLLNVLAYFVLGIVFLGRLEYSALHHRWQAQRTVIAPGMGMHWTRYVVVFTAGVALLAFVLPTNRTLGILGPGQDAWNQLVWFFRAPLSSLLSHLHPTTPTKINPHLRPPPGSHPPPRQPTPHHSGGHGGDWLSVVETVLFWAGALAFTGYLVRAYFKHLRGRVRRPRTYQLPGLLGVFSRLWAAVLRRLHALLAGVAERLPDAISMRLPTPGARHARSLDGGAMGGPTRQQILGYYRRMVRQAERRGFSHPPAQTPEEFAAVLAPEIPQAAGDVALLTDAFIEARYSRHDLREDRLTPIRSGWEHVRTALRNLKR